jgi:hypothetical protein
MTIRMGTSGNKVPYNLTVDTGSGVLLGTYRAEDSLAYCDNALPAKENHLLSPGCGSNCQ